MTKPVDREALAAAIARHLASGGAITRIPEAERKSAEQLARTGPESFFRLINRRGRGRPVVRDYVGR